MLKKTKLENVRSQKGAKELRPLLSVLVQFLAPTWWLTNVYTITPVPGDVKPPSGHIGTECTQCTYMHASKTHMK